MVSFFIINLFRSNWPQGPPRSDSRCGTDGLGQYKTRGLVHHFQKCLWRPGAFFQIGLGCVMTHHHIEGPCTFVFKFWQEYSKWSSCQQLVLQKYSVLHRECFCKTISYVAGTREEGLIYYRPVRKGRRARTSEFGV